MVNPFELTPAEKEENIREMIRTGYSYPQIMKECHVSPSTISKVKKKLLGSENDINSKNDDQKSKETLALKLFSQGRSLLEVAIELDIPSESVITMYQNFLRLQNVDSLISAYMHVKGNIQPFLKLYDLMNFLGMTPDQVARQVEFGLKLPFLNAMRSEQTGIVQSLNWQRQQLGNQLDFMREQVGKCKDVLEFYDTQCQIKKNELATLSEEIKMMKNFIESFDQDEGYVRIKEVANTQTKLIMQNNQAISAVTLSATLEAVRRYPDSQRLFFDIVTSQVESGPPHQNHLMESHAPQLLQLMQQVQNEMAERIAGIIVRTMNSIPT